MPLNLFGKKKPSDSPLRVLHIDDSRWVRIPVAVILRRQFGIRVLEANSGQEGVDLALAERPDLILLDVMMPQMDGFDTLIKLKENPRTKSIPVVMVTARDITREVNMALKLGAVGYLTKPIEEDLLIEKVESILKAEGKMDVQRMRRAMLPPDDAIDFVKGTEAEKGSSERLCALCKGILRFVKEYDAWYCNSCRKYPDLEK